MKYVSLLKFLCMFDIGQLEIYDMIGQAICNSRRAGGEVRSTSLLHSTLVASKIRSCLVAYKKSMFISFFSAFSYLFIYLKLPFTLFQQHYQNFQLLGAWCLLNSLFLILNLSPTALADKGKEKDPLAALRVRDILSRTKEGVGSPKLGPGKGYVSLLPCFVFVSLTFSVDGG